MNDKQLSALFMAQVMPRMQAQSDLAGVTLARKFQPRQQGAATGPVVYFYKLPDHNHGSPQRREIFDTGAGAFQQTQRQLVQSTYQFSAWVPQDPASTSALTESDVLSVVSAIMQSDGLIAAFVAAGVGVQRVTDIRNPYFVDERDRFEAEPSFDIALTHYRTLVSALPAADAYEANISRV